MRSVRSYVLRQGRVSNAQQHAYDKLLPAYGIPYQSTPIDLDEIFGRSAPKIIEIGFGMGEATAQIALAKPDYDFLGIEVHTPGVGGLLKKIEENTLSNIRIIQHDAVEVLTNMIVPASVSGIHIFFPDPWPKKRHHKRRLVQSTFIALASTRLAKDGYLHTATDWQPYAEEMLKVLSHEPTLRNTATDFAPKPFYRPLTKFEQRGLNLGHQVWDLVFRKV